MAGKNTSVYGIYGTVAQAEQATDRLIASGFLNQDISVLMADKQGSREFAHEKNTKAPEGTTTGVTAGGVVGGTLGVLAGIGALAIPGVGPLIAAGPIMAGLAGLGVGGAVGGLIGGLVGMGIPEYEAKRYEGRVKEGGVLLSAHCNTSEDISRAKDILKATGAEDIASTGEESVGSGGIRADRAGETRIERDRITTGDAVAADRVETNRLEADRRANETTVEPVAPYPGTKTKY